MISYNKTWLANSRLQAQIKKDIHDGFISETEFKLVAEKYPVGFYTPGLLVRAGLFILTCVIVVFADGLLSLMFSSSGIVTSFGWILFLGILSYLALEIMVATKFHYRSGVDDALLLISLCLFIGGVAIASSDVNGNPNYTILSGVVFLISLLLTARFADMLTSAVCSSTFLAFIYFLWMSGGAIGLNTVTAVVAIASAFLYAKVYRYKDRKVFIDYENCLVIVKVACLIALYASNNYYVLKTLKDELNVPNKSIPLDSLFLWLWTILIPFIYLWRGIKKKDVILLRTGLILIAAAIATFRTYYHILPLDVMLTIGGAVILAIVYALIKYLKTPKYGFTYAEDGNANLADQLKVESLFVAGAFSHAPAAPVDKGVKFGGGDFGGGGSSGDF